MNRRGFLAGILAAGVAPAAIGSQILMPVRKIIMPLSFMNRYRERLREQPVLVVHPDVHRALKLYPVEIGQIEHFRFIVSDKLPGVK